MPINIDDSINPIADGTPKGLIKTINGLANAIKNISGKPSWKDAPDVSIQQINSQSINSNWLIKTADYIASHGDKIICDARSGNFIITFPANPSPGQFISLVGIGATVINPVFIDLQGKKLNADEPAIVMLQKTAIITTMAYFDNTVGWIADTTITRSSTYLSLILASNPWGYWRLRESSDIVAVDVSPNMRNGNYNGGVTLSPIGDIALFNGVDSFVSLPYEIGAPNNFTLECKIKTASATGALFSFTQDAGTGYASTDRTVYLSGGQLNFFLFPNTSFTLTSSVILNDNQWHTITITLGSRGAEIWIDGALSIADENITSGYTYSGYWHIAFGITGGYFMGAIGDVSITHSQISASDIEARHFASLL